ncbi:MerR family transcriptional regulator [Clostridium thermarum]|uniref:MerR family transcriptional regulator n=1 Tax=Clostridium thermarum TaxID=1716543 RepID=UPI00111CE0C7|nr:MerR family transcriptional regulator [Clostridium thermarum]
MDKSYHKVVLNFRLPLYSPVTGGYRIRHKEVSLTYRIGQFSKLSKTTIKTLRYYDEVGLLKPEVVDDFTGYRFYTTDQLVKLHYIQLVIKKLKLR